MSRRIATVAAALMCASCSAGARSSKTNTDAGPQTASGDAAPASSGDDAGPATSDAGGGPSSSTDAGGDGAASSACGAGAASRGATLPYQEYEAESADTNGTVLGPSRVVNDPNVENSIAGESSGRSAVRLGATGQYVRFTSRCAANSVVLRYVIPDSADGAGTTATLGLYVNGSRVQDLTLTSRYAWAYGNPNTTDTTTNNPGDGYARHFYDEARVFLGAGVPAGATVALQKDATDEAAYYVVDLIDLEEVGPALTQPPNSLSVTAYGATPDDGMDDGAAIQSCLNDAASKGETVWLPPGTYDDASTALSAHGVRVQGAGMWRSTLQGASAYFTCTGGACALSDLALSGDVVLRNDASSVHALAGTFGPGSSLQNLWIEHFTTGPWIGQSGAAPSQGLAVDGCRFRDLFADGINLNEGTSATTVSQCHARNTGDDAFASWSNGSGPNTGNTFQFDTAQVPWRANCFAIYGGANSTVEDSVCADVVTYPGVFVSQEFDSSPFTGMTTVARDTLLRAGGAMYGVAWGALTVDGNDTASPIEGVAVEHVDIESASFSGIYLLGANDSIQGLTLSDVTVEAPGTYGIDLDPTAKGSLTATGVVVTNPRDAGLRDDAGDAFGIDRGVGNIGW
jgi:hypothetical protein